MAIRFFNTLTKTLTEFVPQAADGVKIYTCGVTVYDDCHVGHARSLYIFDALRKYLEYRGYKVQLVRNITDVDDKIINRAQSDGVSFEEIRMRYIASYERDLKALEVDKADFEPRATENIFYMVDHVKRLIAQGAAYEVDGDVYFSVRQFADYGRLSGQSVDEMRHAVRIEADEKKRDPLDFALWKRAKEGEPSWPSPWGAGRPGWHIECSTMSLRFLRTETLDIHAGGRDLVFPHHENEIAQAEALTGKPFAIIWIHHGLLTIDGKKMSKSLGNFITIQDALKRTSPNVLKFFFLGAHYASPIDFTWNGVEEAQRAFEKIQVFLDNVAFETRSLDLGGIPSPDVQKFRNEFENVLDEDFNTAKAKAVYFDLLKFGNVALTSRQMPLAVASAELLRELGNVLGLRLEIRSHRVHKSPEEQIRLSDDKVEILIAERNEARAKKEFKRADEIRDFLKQNGVNLNDREKVD